MGSGRGCAPERRQAAQVMTPRDCPTADALIRAASARHQPDRDLVRLRAAAHWAADACPIAADMIARAPRARAIRNLTHIWRLEAAATDDSLLRIWIEGNVIVLDHAAPGRTATRRLPLPETLRETLQ